MKKNLINSFVMISLTFGFSISNALAEPSLQSDKDITGSWLLEYSTQKLDGAKVSRGESWIFQSGQLEKKNIALARSGTYDVPPVNYKVEGGKLIVSKLGRPGKYDTYTLINQSKNKITLREGLGGSYLYFKKQ